MSRRLRAEDIGFNTVDRLISWFDPKRGVERYRSRVTLALTGAYNAGSRDRRGTKSWKTSAGSADSDALPELPVIRDRALDLERNEPIAAGAVGNAVSAVVGTGLSLQCSIDAKALGMSTEQAEAWQEDTEAKFRAWAGNPSACDASRTQHFYGLQSLAFHSFLSGGDVFATLPMIPNQASEYSLKINLIEAHRCANPIGTQDTNELAGGVKRDEFGAPKAYLFLKEHPGSIHRTSNEYEEIAAFGEKTGRRNVLHLYDKTRPGLSRGLPYLTPVIEKLKQISEYSEAEIHAAVTAGLFTGFVTTTSGQGIAVDPADTGNAAPGSEIKMGYGAIVDLAPNESITFGSPGRPNTAFGPFVDYFCQYVGVALQQPKEVLLKHFTASYSAARAALLDFYRYVMNRRELLAMMFCQPVYEAWLEEAVARGKVAAPGFFASPTIRAAYCGAEWKGDAPPEIDPLKAVAASEKRLGLGLSTKTAETTQLTGGDFVTNVRRRGRELELEREAGLAPQVATNPDAPEHEDDDPDEEDPADREETK